LGFDASVFVAELPSGLGFGLLSDPGLRPGFFRAGGCCATVNLLGLAVLKIYKNMRNNLHTLNTKGIHRESRNLGIAMFAGKLLRCR
jgi:hypothetical protein